MYIVLHERTDSMTDDYKCDCPEIYIFHVCLPPAAHSHIHAFMDERSRQGFSKK